MSYQSSANPDFLNTVQEWLAKSGEVLALIRFHTAAGDKSWEFFDNFSDFSSRLDTLPPQSCVIVFQHHPLQLRGIVDEAFITESLALFDSLNDCLLVCLDKVSIGKQSWHHWMDIYSTAELEEELRNPVYCFGKRVALGPEPRWIDTSEGLVDAVTPFPDGSVVIGVY